MYATYTTVKARWTGEDLHSDACRVKYPEARGACARAGSASKRKYNDSKRFQDFYLKSEAIIQP